MTKAVYDTNGNNKVDAAENADAVPWIGITGKPATFPPDATAMLKSVYDVNGNNKVDTAESADAVPWTGISSKPATFPAAAHGTTHLDNGTDVVPVATITRTGLCPKFSNDPATFLNGSGVFSAPAGTADPGVWTALSLQAGWTAPSQAEYRVQTIGAIKTVFFRGFVQGAYAALSSLVTNLAVGARPSIARVVCLGGAQATGTASDVAAYVANISSAGDLRFYFLSGGPFIWADPSQTQVIYLDGLLYSL
jgi:hypothetical protein